MVFVLGQLTGNGAYVCVHNCMCLCMDTFIRITVQLYNTQVCSIRTTALLCEKRMEVRATKHATRWNIERPADCVVCKCIASVSEVYE